MNDAFGYGKNDLSGNPRTIRLNNANIFNLHDGQNDLRAATTGAQNVINGTVLCVVPPSMSAAKNRWKSSGAPTSSDYNVTRLCSPSSLLSITDPAPLNFSIACADEPPGNPEFMSDGVGDGLFGSESASNQSLFDEAYYYAMEQLLSASSVPEISLSGQMSTNEFEDVEDISTSTINHVELLMGLEAMTEILNSPDAANMLGVAKYIVGFTLAFDAYSEIRKAIQMGEFVADAQEIGGDVVNLTYSVGELYTAVGSDQELFYYQLQLAQARRMTGNYIQATEAVEGGYIYTDIEESIALADQIHCYLEAEMNASITEEFLNSIAECQGFGLDNGMQALLVGNNNSTAYVHSLDANPNPVEDAVFISSEGEPLLADEIVIFDMQGRQVRTLSSQSTTRIDMQGLPTGVYMIITYYNNGEVGKSKVFKL